MVSFGNSVVFFPGGRPGAVVPVSLLFNFPRAHFFSGPIFREPILEELRYVVCRPVANDPTIQ